MLRELLNVRVPTNVTVANCVSAIGLFLCVAAGLYAANHSSLVFVALLFLLGALCDVLDGLVARWLKEASPWGAYVDALCDKLGEIAVLLGLACRVDDPGTIRWLMAAAALSLVGSYQKPLVAEKGRPMPWPEARYLGRGLRVSVMVIGLLICGLHSAGDASLRSLAQALTMTAGLIFVWREKRIEVTAYMERLQAWRP